MEEGSKTAEREQGSSADDNQKEEGEMAATAAKRAQERKVPENKAEKADTKKPVVITPTEVEPEKYNEYPSVTGNKMVVDIHYYDSVLWIYDKYFRYECPAGEVVTLQIPERMRGRFDQDYYEFSFNYKGRGIKLLSYSGDTLTIKLPDEFTVDPRLDQYKDYYVGTFPMEEVIFEMTAAEPAVGVLPDVDPEVYFSEYRFDPDSYQENARIHLSKMIQDVQKYSDHEQRGWDYQYKIGWKKLDVAGKSSKPSAFDGGWTAMADGELFRKGYYYAMNILVNNNSSDAVKQNSIPEYAYPVEIYINDKPADAVNYSENNVYWLDFEENALNKIAVSVDKIFDPIHFALSYNTNGGNALADTEADNGGFVKKAAAPSKTGLAFAGWYADKALTIPFDFSKPLTADTTIYAKWIVPGETENTEKTKMTAGGAEEKNAAAVRKASGAATVKTTAVRIKRKTAQAAVPAGSRKTTVASAAPETGDRTEIALYMILLAAAAAGIAALGIHGKRVR